MFRKIRTIANVRVGRPDTPPHRPSHVRGVRMGNQRGSTAQQGGHEELGLEARASAERSTGINPQQRNPIDPRSPTLSPA